MTDNSKVIKIGLLSDPSKVETSHPNHVSPLMLNQINNREKLMPKNSSSQLISKTHLSKLMHPLKKTTSNLINYPTESSPQLKSNLISFPDLYQHRLFDPGVFTNQNRSRENTKTYLVT